MHWKTFCCSENKSDMAMSVALLVLRLAAGAIFIWHGWDKIFGATTIAGFTGLLTQLGVPAPLYFAWFVAVLELAGGVLLVLGVWARPVALLLFINMLVAIFVAKSGKFFPVIDLDVALAAISLAIAKIGAGNYSLMKAWK